METWAGRVTVECTDAVGWIPGSNGGGERIYVERMVTKACSGDATRMIGTGAFFISSGTMTAAAEMESRRELCLALIRMEIEDAFA
jgi:hypothetical protein